VARKAGKDRGILEKPAGSGKWWVRLTMNGREKWFRATNKSQAKALYGRLKAEAREETYFPEKYKKTKQVTLRAWITRHLEGCSNRSVANSRRHGRFWSLLLGNRTLRDISTEDLRRIQAQLKARYDLKKANGTRRKAPPTINRYFSYLRHVLTLAVNDGKIDRNPMSGVKFFPEAIKTRFLTDDEIARLRHLMEPRVWEMVAFAIETGLRRSEQFNLRWSQIDMDNRVLNLPMPKGSKSRYVPLTDGVCALLSGWDSFTKSPFVFPGKDPLKPLDARSFVRWYFDPALRRAGIVGASWHSLRHTAATRRVLSGASLYGVQQLLGHRDIKTTARYSHLTPGFMQETVAKGSLFASPQESQAEVRTGSKTGSGLRNLGGTASQPIDFMVRPVGIEPTTLSLEG